MQLIPHNRLLRIGKFEIWVLKIIDCTFYRTLRSVFVEILDSCSVWLPNEAQEATCSSGPEHIVFWFRSSWTIEDIDKFAKSERRFYEVFCSFLDDSMALEALRWLAWLPRIHCSTSVVDLAAIFELVRCNSQTKDFVFVKLRPPLWIHPRSRSKSI